ncbi:MAG: hypothetical protein H6582_13735 [Crocinitomicaceae bacterium]|nr:hypothetical protein [Crocinitomicaceae bacterium]
MLKGLIKRKLDADRLANVFVNSILEISDNGFEDLKEMIKYDPAFVSNPEVENSCADKFLLIITVGNLNQLHHHFEVVEAEELRRLIIEKFARIFEISSREFEDLLEQTSSYISQVNHPSKNLLYGMSKAVFHKFNLNEHQEDYFRTLKTPNPLFLKRMDEVMSNFLWDWDQFFKKHKISLN